MVPQQFTFKGGLVWIYHTSDKKFLWTHVSPAARNALMYFKNPEKLKNRAGDPDMYIKEFSKKENLADWEENSKLTGMYPAPAIFYLQLKLRILKNSMTPAIR